MKTNRYLKSTPELDAAESAWWERFSAWEKQFAADQTPAMMKFLRGRYVRKIARAIKPLSAVVEFGCGSGWLSIWLAKSGIRGIVGFDFSDSQIKLARQAGTLAKVDTYFLSCNPDSFHGCQFDIIIMHGFLHHLSVEEIQSALEIARRLLAKDGKLFIFEPVIYEQSPAPAGATHKGLRLFKNIKAIAEHFGLFHRGPKEILARNIMNARGVAQWPLGPSPKETAFLPLELPHLLSGRFTIKNRSAEMLYTYPVAQELLLAELTYPRLVKLIKWPVLWLVRLFDRRALRKRMFPPNLWVFELFECEPVK